MFPLIFKQIYSLINKSILLVMNFELNKSETIISVLKTTLIDR